jgi:lactam utilization protein B
MASIEERLEFLEQVTEALSSFANATAMQRAMNAVSVKKDLVVLGDKVEAKLVAEADAIGEGIETLVTRVWDKDGSVIADRRVLTGADLPSTIVQQIPGAKRGDLITASEGSKFEILAIYNKA